MPEPTSIAQRVATELSLPSAGVGAVLALMSDGATVPFIARYRKERTGSLDEVQIRTIGERAAYLRELGERRATVLASIEEQGALTDALAAAIAACTTKQELEDLYLPFRPKRRTRAQIARERGLEPLADRILAQPNDGDPEAEAEAFIDPEAELPNADTVLAGARDIVIEGIAERAELRSAIRQALARDGVVQSQLATGKEGTRSKFEDYYDYREPIAKIPSHRILALTRGETEGFLKVRLELELDEHIGNALRSTNHVPGSPFAAQLEQAARDAVERRIFPSLETEQRSELKQRADRDAIGVFAENLEQLLLAPPFGSRPTLGIDPGLRTGCKCVALDGTGKLLAHKTIFPARGTEAKAEAAQILRKMLEKHEVEAIAVGNGTGGKEVERLVRDIVRAGTFDTKVISVNEAGASVYSASDVAREEFPRLDVAVRGAISIGRRLQDPLAELVKIEPKSIGVGQYQHDVNQRLLQQKLHDVVESCVNRVGVDLNTASPSLLSYVAGIGPALAKRIVQHREENGRFATRQQLLDVPGLGARTFEQAAGFLRIRAGDEPLDASAVHPERYALVEKMAEALGLRVAELIGAAGQIRKIDVSQYVSDDVGEPTLRDILSELEKPGRDPRRSFTTAKFRDDVNELKDLEEGMKLEGVVTNVTDFGAFVDIGVHQDGLVHISQLADKFIKHPSEAVKVGDKLSVRVVGVDLERKRISLTARSEAPPKEKKAGGPRRDKGGPQKGDRKGRDQGGRRDRGKGPRGDRSGFKNNPFAALLGGDK